MEHQILRASDEVVKQVMNVKQLAPIGDTLDIDGEGKPVPIVIPRQETQIQYGERSRQQRPALRSISGRTAHPTIVAQVSDLQPRNPRRFKFRVRQERNEAWSFR